MVKHDVFYQRLEGFCKLCPEWRGVCLKGHQLSSPEGCPLQKFPPVDGAAYAVVGAAKAQVVKLGGCCGADVAMRPLTWAQVMTEFAKAMLAWISAGLPVVNNEAHAIRYGKCQGCDQFNGFYCTHCKCIAYLKTKVATESCPKPNPEWVSASGPGG